MLGRILIFVSLFTFLSGCARKEPVEGGIYYTRSERGDFTVLKVLKVDDRGVHVRLYSNRFPEPPTHIDESTLYIAGLDRRPDEELGMGHLPLLKQSFAGWRAKFIQKSKVSEEELDGYRIWQEGGGYW